MKRVTWLLALVLVALIACRRVNWQEFSSAEGRFAVLAPGTPKADRETTRTEAGVLEQNIYTVEYGDAAYTVMYCDYPRELVGPLTRDAMLDGALEGAVGSIAGKPLPTPSPSGASAAASVVPSAAPARPAGMAVTNTAIAIDGHPGRALRTAKDGIDYHVRIYLVGNRLYQLLITARSETAKAEDELRFMDSFRLLK